jgi:hypothetical protein
MILPIVRLFDSAAKASAALAKLADWGFLDSDISVVSPSGTGHTAAASGEDPIVSQITSAMVLRSHARTLANGVRRGGTLVIVRAPFGTGGIAANILDRAGPVDSGVPDAAARKPAWDDAAPLSSALWAPTLVDSDDSFSRFWGLPLLTRWQRTLCSALGMGELASPDFSLFGTPALTRNPSPLSSTLGLPVLFR